MVAKVSMSVSTMQAVVLQDNGDQFALILHRNPNEALAELQRDARSGKLDAWTSMQEPDRQVDIDDTFAEADDWETIFPVTTH